MAGKDVPKFAAEFLRMAGGKDALGLYDLLRNVENLGGEASAKGYRGKDTTVNELVRAQCAGETEERLEALCAALQSWCVRYSGAQGLGRWLIPPLLRLAAAPRRAAAALDRAAAEGEAPRKRRRMFEEGGGELRHQTKLVEALREQFQRLHRDREKREGALVVCCELLRLYFCLGQASQCTFLLAAVKNQDLDMARLPKALSVPFCFQWGKHCVLDGNVVDAEERLSWALRHCPPGATANRRKIMRYLVPCRLRFGRFPGKDTLRRHGLESCFAGLTRAVATGDVQLFNQELEAHEVELIRAGTYLVVEKLKLLAYQSLCRRVYGILAGELAAAGKAEHRHKQDLAGFERAFEWQDGCDSDEVICILANLIDIGGMRGYLSDEHRKVVFSKEAPFPPAPSWCPKA